MYTHDDTYNFKALEKQNPKMYLFYNQTTVKCEMDHYLFIKLSSKMSK